MKCVLTAEKWSNYTAFGFDMPGRNVTPSDGYKYSFNGKLDDKSDGWQTQDYGYRSYDYRLGRFFSEDPLRKMYAYKTPYDFAENDVIRCTDLDGKEKKIVIYKFTDDAITRTTLDLETAGELGDGILVKIVKNGTTNYMYGEALAVAASENQITLYDASDNLKSLHESTEGRKNTYYLDSEGLPTIGIGHLIKVNEKKKYPEGTTLTDDEVDGLYTSDMSVREGAIENLLETVDLTQNEGDAIFDFHFNTGRANEYLSSGENSYFFLGYMAGGRGIWKRRISEQMMYESGTYINFDFKKSTLKMGKLKTSVNLETFVNDAETNTSNENKKVEQYDKTQKWTVECEDNE